MNTKFQQKNKHKLGPIEIKSFNKRIRNLVQLSNKFKVPKKKKKKKKKLSTTKIKSPNKIIESVI